MFHGKMLMIKCDMKDLECKIVYTLQQWNENRRADKNQKGLKKKNEINYLARAVERGVICFYF